MAPTNGTRARKIHHPFLPVSCSRRTLTPSDGRNTVRVYSIRRRLGTAEASAKSEPPNQGERDCKMHECEHPVFCTPGAAVEDGILLQNFQVPIHARPRVELRGFSAARTMSRLRKNTYHLANRNCQIDHGPHNRDLMDVDFSYKNRRATHWQSLFQ